MTFFDIPTFTGTAEEQLEQIKNYLFLQHEQLNYNLEQTQPEKIWEQTQTAIRNADNALEPQAVQDTYKSLRDLIVATADVAISRSDTVQRMLEQMQAFRSDYGVFSEEITRTIEETAQATDDNFTYIGRVESALGAYKLEMGNFIKTGYLDTSANPPVFGIDIGLLQGSYSVDGTTISNQTPRKIRITPDKLSFYDNTTEVAYISSGAIYFPNAQITGGSINIGNGAFQVSSAGVLSATGATISGTITAAANSSFGGWTIGTNAIYRGSETFEGSNTIYFGKDGISIGNKFSVDDDGKLTCESATIGGWTVDANSLSRTYGSGSSAVTFTLGGSGSGGGIIIGGNNSFNSSGHFTSTSATIGGWTVNANVIQKVLNNGTGIQLLSGRNTNGGGDPQILIVESITNSNSYYTTLSLESIASVFTNASFKATSSNGGMSTWVNPIGLMSVNSNYKTYAGWIGIYTNGPIIGGNLTIGGELSFSSNASATDVTNSAKNLMDVYGNNYIVFGGYVFQWGYQTLNLSANSTTTGSISFPYSSSYVTAITAVANSSVPAYVNIGIKTNGDYAVSNTSSSGANGVSFTWFAIGKK